MADAILQSPATGGAKSGREVARRSHSGRRWRHERGMPRRYEAGRAGLIYLPLLPSATERDFYVGLLQGSGGSMTQAELLMLAAIADLNALNIKLMGLDLSGVEFI